MGIQKFIFTLVAFLVTFTIGLPSTSVDAPLVERDNTAAGNLITRQGGTFTQWGSWGEIPMLPSYSQLCGANNPNDPTQCILVNISDDQGEFVSFYLYDNNCNEIGAAQILYPPQSLSFYSQLPWTLEFNMVEFGPNQWWYAGRHWGGNDGYESLFCFNTGGANTFRPACKMIWQCR